MTQSRACIGVVVPSLAAPGGVATVAEFICNTIERSGIFDLRLVSLSVAARGASGLSLTRPTTWLRGVRATPQTWRGREYLEIGAFASELEFQRFQPRTQLRDALADCDLIQVVSGSPAYGWAVAGMGKPLALQCATLAGVERRLRDASAHSAAALWRRRMTAVTAQFETRALQAADAVQVENRWMFDHVRKVTTGRPTLVRMLAPGIDTDWYHPARGTRSKLESSVAVSPGSNRFRGAPAAPRPREDTYMLSVGRLSDPRKNLRLLLEACARLPDSLSQRVRLVVAGATPPTPQFWSAVAALGLQNRVTFVSRPTREELRALYQQAAVFALSSDEEGLGLALIEAMACGIPAVATRCGGPEEVITDGADGLLVPVDDSRAFADALASLLDDEAANLRLGAAARRTAVARFDQRIAARGFIQTWRELLGLRRPTVSISDARMTGR